MIIDNYVKVRELTPKDTMNGFIHLLLVIAIVVVLVRIIQGRKILR